MQNNNAPKKNLTRHEDNTTDHRLTDESIQHRKREVYDLTFSAPKSVSIMGPNSDRQLQE